MLLLNGDYESKDIVPLMIETFEFIRDFEGEVPGASAKDCGNYLDMNLPMAKYLAGKFLDEVLYDIKPDSVVGIYSGLRKDSENLQVQAEQTEKKLHILQCAS